ncbi:hypothetical protein HYW41_00275 [Candidatus Daviesbacteria bacterium]|nr:hypothetical protein [Candidatus Daviesbacteria bacterium]
MAKVLVTHINPHLDDICGIWLFKKFHPQFKDAQVEFISASHDKAGQETADRVFVGTGGGRFDEHKEGLDTCAGSLVYEYLKEQGFIPSGLTQKALEKLVSWNKLIDTGKAPNNQFDEFSIQSFIRTKANSNETSQKSVALGREILDRVLKVLKRKEQSLLDWEKRVEFESEFGKSYAVISETVDREFVREQGRDLFLMYNPKYPAVQFFAPEADIEAIYKKVKELDPKADWFLHQSHHMVICGSSSAPDSKPTKLSFEQLIEVAKSA